MYKTGCCTLGCQLCTYEEKRQKIKHFLIMIKRGNQIELFVRAAEREREKERASKALEYILMPQR